MKNQKTVVAHFTSEQLLSFGFAGHCRAKHIILILINLLRSFRHKPQYSLDAALIDY